MGRDTECDQRIASIPVTQSGPHASVARVTTRMTECLVLVDPPVAHHTNIITGCGSHANPICDQICLSATLDHIKAATVHLSTLWTLKAIRSWLLVAFQGAQVANKAGKVLGAHLIRIRRHGVRCHNFKFAKIRLLKRPELAVAVHHLNAETIVPQKSSRNRLSIACYQLDAPILGSNIFLRRHQRGPYFLPGPPRSNRGQVRSTYDPVSPTRWQERHPFAVKSSVPLAISASLNGFSFTAGASFGSTSTALAKGLPKFAVR